MLGRIHYLQNYRGSETTKWQTSPQSTRKRMVMNLSGGESGWSDSSTELSNWRHVSLTGSSSGCPSQSQGSVDVVVDYHLSL